MQSHATETNQMLWFYSFFRFSIWKNYFQLSALPLFTLLRGPWKVKPFSHYSWQFRTRRSYFIMTIHIINFYISHSMGQEREKGVIIIYRYSTSASRSRQPNEPPFFGFCFNYFVNFSIAITSSAFHKLLEIFQKVSRNFLQSCSKGAQKYMESCFL